MNIVIIGAGPGLGTSIARRFGKEGARVVLAARGKSRLDETVAAMRAEGMDAYAVTIDLTDAASIETAFAEIREILPEIDLMIFNPRLPYKPPYKATAIDPDEVMDFFKWSTVAAIRCTANVIPDMMERDSGAIIFSGGASAAMRFPPMATVGVATAGQLNFAAVLAEELKSTSIYVGAVTIAAKLVAGTPDNPDRVAEIYWEMYQQRSTFETFYSPATS